MLGGQMGREYLKLSFPTKWPGELSGTWLSRTVQIIIQRSGPERECEIRKGILHLKHRGNRETANLAQSTLRQGSKISPWFGGGTKEGGDETQETMEKDWNKKGHVFRSFEWFFLGRKKGAGSWEGSKNDGFGGQRERKVARKTLKSRGSTVEIGYR